MLLTITTTHRPATDLGYLLGKNPARLQSIELGFGHAQLERLRGRGLQRKRRLALAEFALGAEALYRFVAAEPLWRVHECVFGVLALESEPVDPRL